MYVCMYYLSSFKDMFTGFRERGEGREEERERSIDVREKQQWVASCTSPSLDQPKTLACALTESRAHHLSVYRTMAPAN